MGVPAWEPAEGASVRDWGVVLENFEEFWKIGELKSFAGFGGFFWSGNMVGAQIGEGKIRTASYTRHHTESEDGLETI